MNLSVTCVTAGKDSHKVLHGASTKLQEMGTQINDLAS